MNWLAKMAFGFRRGDLPEVPPRDFRDLPPGPGYKIQYFDSQPSLESWARENHIAANDAYNPRHFMGGVAPSIKVIGLLRPGLTRDPVFDARVYQHEVGGHSNELVHAPGGARGDTWGYQGPDGRFWPVQTMADLLAAKARYAAPPAPPAVPFDWSGAFARGPAQPAVPMKGGR